MDSSYIIRLKHVSKVFKGATAVDNISLDIRKGEFLSLLGPSGCGKTTTLRMIAGFEQPSSGVIELDGVDTKQLPPYKRPVNTVFQNYALFPHLTIYENIAFGLRRKGLDKRAIHEQVNAALDMMGLAEHAQKYPKQLSGGQQQRVALARALVNKPKVLLLDEPLGALDLKLRKKMQFELKRLHEQVGITFIYVTHDQEEALVMSDRIAVMNKGKIEQVGTPEDVYRNPRTGFVADFIGEANVLKVRADGKSRELRLFGCRLPVDFEAEEYLVVIRPEQIQIVNQSFEYSGYMKVPAVIKDITYAGPKTIVRAVAQGEWLTIHHSNTERHELIHPGNAVSLAWKLSDVRVLR